MRVEPKGSQVFEVARHNGACRRRHKPAYAHQRSVQQPKPALPRAKGDHVKLRASSCRVPVGGCIRLLGLGDLLLLLLLLHVRGFAFHQLGRATCAVFGAHDKHVLKRKPAKTSSQSVTGWPTGVDDAPRGVVAHDRGFEDHLGAFSQVVRHDPGNCVARRAAHVIRVVRHRLLAVRVRLHALRQVVAPGAREAAVHLREQQQALVVRLAAERDGDSCARHIDARV